MSDVPHMRQSSLVYNLRSDRIMMQRFLTNLQGSDKLQFHLWQHEIGKISLLRSACVRLLGDDMHQSCEPFL